jgi:hypothetical protein
MTRAQNTVRKENAMNAKLQVVLLVGLLTFSSALPAQFPTEDPVYVRLTCDGVDVRRQTHQTETFVTWDGREVCYELKVECRNAEFPFGATWFEWKWDGRPLVRWFAMALPNGSVDVGICGDIYKGNGDYSWLPIPWKNWNTSCRFAGNSRFFANSEEVEAADCEGGD